MKNMFGIKTIKITGRCPVLGAWTLTGSDFALKGQQPLA